MSSLTQYLKHPDRLDRESLYTLRTLVARHPNYTSARIALLHNLFVLHDPSFGEELRKAAFLVPDRRVLFDLVEADKYHIEPEAVTQSQQEGDGSARTQQLIDKFLGKAAQEDHRLPTVADATTDYAAFLLSLEDAPASTPKSDNEQDTTGRLVETFLSGGAKFQVNDKEEPAPQQQEPAEQTKKVTKRAKPAVAPAVSADASEDDGDDSFFTETLAKIYIKQGRFAKALEIISTINANYPNKSVYFADQMRYLRKLIINENQKK